MYRPTTTTTSEQRQLNRRKTPHRLLMLLAIDFGWNLCEIEEIYVCEFNTTKTKYYYFHIKWVDKLSMCVWERAQHGCHYTNSTTSTSMAHFLDKLRERETIKYWYFMCVRFSVFFSLIFRASLSSQLGSFSAFNTWMHDCRWHNIIFPHRELAIASIRISLRSLSACTHNPTNASRTEATIDLWITYY